MPAAPYGAMLRRIVIILMVALLPGCAAWNWVWGAPYIGDLRLEEIAWKERYTLPSFYRDGSPGRTVGAGLLIAISSQWDLGGMMATNDDTVRPDFLSINAAYCKAGTFDRDQPLTHAGLLFDAFGNMVNVAVQRSPVQRNAAGRYLFFTFLPATTDGMTRQMYGTAIGHDLTRDRHDVCLRLDGMFSSYARLTSNTVVVPAAAIHAAIAARASP